MKKMKKKSKHERYCEWLGKCAESEKCPPLPRDLWDYAYGVPKANRMRRRKAAGVTVGRP